MFNSCSIVEIPLAIKKYCPLIHCITNYVTANDCANILVAAGASPCMVDEIQTAEETARVSAAVNLNLGTLRADVLEVMLVAARLANKVGAPVTLDPVGAGFSTFRNHAAERILRQTKISAIRGNMSELKSLSAGVGSSRGVDVAPEDAINETNYREKGSFLRILSRRLGTIVVASGAIDLITDGKTLFGVHNGTPVMGQISGGGCMLTALVCSWLAANRLNGSRFSDLETCAAAVAAYDVCGEIAADKTARRGGGIGSFRVELLDAVNTTSIQFLQKAAKVETIE